jgi:GntR family transcriptional repressor for pyruvate dehydrogenase complex
MRVPQSLEPIRPRTRLYEEVAERVREYIETRGLAAGDRLPTEREFAEILGVSRTSIRQGLTALRTIGLIDIRHGDGVYLRRSAADVQPEVAREMVAAQRAMPAVMETREALETQIARLAAERRRRADLVAMEAALAAMQRAIDAEEPTQESDTVFHAALADAARNALLVDLMRQLAEPIALTRHASLSLPGRPRQSLEEHRYILAAVRARDPDAASEAMRAHLRAIARLTRR